MRAYVFLILALLFFTCVPASAFAESLDQAKSSGLLGEKADGYLGLVDPGASASVKALMDDINQKRRAEYSQIAQKNGTDLQAVEVLAGQKAIAKTPAGQFVQSQTGGWVKK